MNGFPKWFVPAVVVGALAVAGCGGDDDASSSTADAKQQYEQIQTSLSNYKDELGAAIRSASGKTDAELSAQFDELAAKASDQRAAIEELDVPEDLEDERDDLADSVSDGVDDIQTIAAAAKTRDVEAATAATKKLLLDSAKIQTAGEVLRQKLADATK